MLALGIEIGAGCEYNNICRFNLAYLPMKSQKFEVEVVSPEGKTGRSKFACPYCESEDTTTHLMAYAKGTSSREQTVLAGLLTPPQSAKFGALHLVVFGVFIIVAFLAFILEFSFVVGIAAAILASIAVWAGVRQIVAAQRKANNAKLAQWESEMICLRCGKDFLPY